MRTPTPQSTFRPAWGLGNPHAQTIWPSLFRLPHPLPTTREVWQGPDGPIDVVLGPHSPAQPGVLLLHGLEGSARSPYLQGLMAAVHAADWNVAILEFRSCGPSLPAVPQLYHSGKTDEIAFAVATLCQRWQSAIAVCGFSLGGNALLKWLAEAPAPRAVRAAVGVSVPFDLSACADALDGPGFFARIYRRHFLRSLKRKALQTAARHAVPFTPQTVRKLHTLRAFDDQVTAPLFGFASAADYYARNSSCQFLAAISVPTLLVAAADDPFIPPSVLPYEVASANPALTLRVWEKGGHTGFMAGRPGRLRYEVDAWAVDFLRPHLEP